MRALDRGHGRSIGVHATGGNSVDINWVGGGISFWEFGIKITDDSGENEASIAVSGDTGFSSNLGADYKANCRSDVRVEGAFTEGSGRFLETQATGSGAAGLLAIRNLRVNTIRSPDHAVVRLLGPSMLSLQAVFFSGGCEGPVNDCPQTIATDDNRSVVLSSGSKCKSPQVSVLGVLDLATS